MSDFYVDGGMADDAGDGTSPATAKKTLSAGHVAANGDGHTLWIKRGYTYVYSMTLDESRTIRPYGTGTPPKINPSTTNPVFLLNTAGKTVDVYGIDIQGLAALATSRVVYADDGALNLYYCIVRESQGRGVNVNGGSCNIYNCLVTANRQSGVEVDAGTCKMRNCIVVGNGKIAAAGTNNGVRDDCGGLDIDYCYVIGNNIYTSSNVSYHAGTTDGFYNVYDTDPQLTSHVVNTGYCCFTFDDIDYAYIEACLALLPSGFKVTWFIRLDEIYNNATAIADASAWNALGHEIAVHTWSHTELDNTDAFTVTRAADNPTVNVDIANNRIVLSCDVVGDIVTVDWTAAFKTIADLRTAVAGKGWTITNATYTIDTLKLSSLVDTVGAQAVGAGFLCTLDRSAPNYRFYDNEIDGVIDWIATNAGTRPVTIAYPRGAIDTDTIDYIYGLVPNLKGGRIADVSAFNVLLSSIPIYQVASILSTASNVFGTFTEADCRKAARHLYNFMMVNGCLITLYTHTAVNMTAAQFGYFADEWDNCGGSFVTFKTAIEGILASHSTADNRIYTKTYADALNGELQSTSPCIGAGTGVSLTEDILGNPVIGTPDIGPYQTAKGGGGGLSLGMGVGGGGQMPPWRRRRR